MFFASDFLGMVSIDLSHGLLDGSGTHLQQWYTLVDDPSQHKKGKDSNKVVIKGRIEVTLYATLADAAHEEEEEGAAAADDDEEEALPNHELEVTMVSVNDIGGKSKSGLKPYGTLSIPKGYVKNVQHPKNHDQLKWQSEALKGKKGATHFPWTQPDADMVDDRHRVNFEFERRSSNLYIEMFSKVRLLSLPLSPSLPLSLSLSLSSFSSRFLLSFRPAVRLALN